MRRYLDRESFDWAAAIGPSRRTGDPARASLWPWIALGLTLLIALFAGFFAPYSPQQVHSLESAATFPVHFGDYLCNGPRYRLWASVEAEMHLFCPRQGEAVHLLGLDAEGRDRLSRLLYALRNSLLLASISAMLATLIAVVVQVTARIAGPLLALPIHGVTLALRAIPSVFWYLALASWCVVEGSNSLTMISLAIMLAARHWAEAAVPIRTALDQRMQQRYVLHARLLGTLGFRERLTLLLPGLPRIIIAATIGLIPSLLAVEAIGGAFGIGLPPAIAGLGSFFADTLIDHRSAWPAQLAFAVLLAICTIACHRMAQAQRS
ncbi:hypothetical protein OAS86_06525 [Gammaproteobacteria bacterium]|nr:hypothetical protein [Gammaproteobacteria bacterium]